MKRYKVFFVPLFLMSLLLAACQSNIDPVHKEYIESHGWHVESQVGQSTHPKNSIPEEILDNFQASGVDLAPYVGEELMETRYQLEEERAGRSVTAVVYEVGGKIVEGHVTLPDATPGVHPIEDRNGAMK